MKQLKSTAQTGDLCLLLFPGEEDLLGLRQRQAVLQARYGGQIYDDVHITCQRFTPSPEQSLTDLLDNIALELRLGHAFPLYTNELVQFYARFWKNYVIRWQVQRTWAWQQFRQRVERMLLDMNCTLHYPPHQAAVCSALVLDMATNLRPYPDVVFPHHLFDVGQFVVSQIEGPGQFRQLVHFQLEETV